MGCIVVFVLNENNICALLMGVEKKRCFVHLAYLTCSLTVSSSSLDIALGGSPLLATSDLKLFTVVEVLEARRVSVR